MKIPDEWRLDLAARPAAPDIGPQDRTYVGLARDTARFHPECSALLHVLADRIEALGAVVWEINRKGGA